MTDKLLQASDAAALVRQNIDKVVDESIDDILEFIDYAARSALTSMFTDEHPNPDVQEGIVKKLEALGYKIQILEDREIKITWSK